MSQKRLNQRWLAAGIFTKDGQSKRPKTRSATKTQIFGRIVVVDFWDVLFLGFVGLLRSAYCKKGIDDLICCVMSRVMLDDVGSLSGCCALFEHSSRSFALIERLKS